MGKKRRFLIETDISVRSYDIDSAGHVSNIAYLRWMEDMRWQLFNRFYPLEPLMALGLVPVIASTEIQYKKPIRLFDKPKGYMWIASLGNASLQFEGEIWLNGSLATHATHTGVFVNSQRMKPQRLPQDLVTKFHEFAADMERV